MTRTSEGILERLRVAVKIRDHKAARREIEAALDVAAGAMFARQRVLTPDEERGLAEIRRLARADQSAPGGRIAGMLDALQAAVDSAARRADRLAEVEVLGDWRANEIYKALRAVDGEMTVNDLVRAVGFNPSYVSKKLLYLADRGFVARRRDGHKIYNRALI